MIERKVCPMRHPDNGNCQPAGGFCTAVSDPICEALHSAYDLGGFDLFRRIKKEPCKLCGKEYASYESRITLADGGWSTLYFGAEPDGTLFMSAAGDGETDHYHPKFCPECGRQLREGGEGT